MEIFTQELDFTVHISDKTPFMPPASWVTLSLREEEAPFGGLPRTSAQALGQSSGPQACPEWREEQMEEEEY